MRCGVKHHRFWFKVWLYLAVFSPETAPVKNQNLHSKPQQPTHFILFISLCIPRWQIKKLEDFKQFPPFCLQIKSTGGFIVLSQPSHWLLQRVTYVSRRRSGLGSVGDASWLFSVSARSWARQVRDVALHFYTSTHRNNETCLTHLDVLNNHSRRGYVGWNRFLFVAVT